MDLDLAQRISKLSPEQRKIFELKLIKQGIDISLIPITKVSRQGRDRFPLSFAQERLWFIDQLEPGNAAYNIIRATKLEGNLDKNTLERSINEIIQRHEILRTIFIFDKKKPTQVILNELSLTLKIIDLKDLAKDDQDSEVKRLIQRESMYSFNLAKGPLLRTHLLELTSHEYIFILVIHHIIVDGISVQIFERELAQLYTEFSFSSDEESEFRYVLPEVPIQYVDYACWQQRWLQTGGMGNESIKKQEKYWLNEFFEEIPVLTLPTDYPRPVIQSFEGNSENFPLGIKETKALNKIASVEKVTLFTLLLALFNIFLSKISGMEDIVVGTPVAGRRHPDVQNLIGMFINTLALRNYPCGDKTFKDFLKEVKERTLKAFENQDYQVEDLVKNVSVTRDTSRNPLFDVMFLLDNLGNEKVNLPGLTLKPYYEYEEKISRFDLILSSWQEGETLHFRFEYSTKLFKQRTIVRFIKYLKKIISSLVEEPEAKISGIEILPNDEKKKILYDFNDTEAEYPRNKSIHGLFEEQAIRSPNRTALVGPGPRPQVQMTYRELNETSTQLVYLLQAKSVKSDNIVGIMIQRSIEMIIGILGILKAGGTYLPLDPEYPKNRINYMLADSGANVLVTTSTLVEKVKKLRRWEGEIVYLSTTFCNSPLERGGPKGRGVSNLAYIIYTSGTTGSPKGTLIEHRNVVRLLFNDKFQFDFNEKDVWTLFHSFSFDFSVWEMYGALLYGGQLLVVPPMMARDPQLFLQVLKDHKVTVLNQKPSAFYNLIAEELKNQPGNKLNIKYIIFGGEALKPVKLKEWKEKYPGTRLVNMFGITETTVHVTYKEISDAEIELNISNIGKPIPTLTTYVMDQYQKPVPIGVPGELSVGGEGVGRGYLNRVELTHAKFVTNPYKSNERIYHSGDLGRWLDNGEMEYLGRMDQQVKIRGYRIELGEIENQLLIHPGIKETVVIAKDDEKGNKYLCAYIVPIDPNLVSSEKGFVVSELRNHLSGKLPDHMVPATFVEIDRIPLTGNGKVDLKALSRLAPDRVETGTLYEGPRNEIERKIQNSWKEILGLEKISILDNFFELGGDSLKSITAAAAIYKETNIKIPLEEFFRNPFIKGLAQYLQNAPEDKYAAVEPVEKQEFYPLSASQKHMFILNQFMTYNIPATMVIEGKLARERFENAFQKLVKRHECLRTSFEMIGGEPIQRVHDEVEFKIEYYDLTTEERREKTEDRGQMIEEKADTNLSSKFNLSSVIRHLSSDFFRAFDLLQPPLIRVGLVNRSETRHLFLFNIHHIISDGTTIGILAQEFIDLCEGTDLPELKIQYKDFSQWEHEFFKTEAFKIQEKYWLKEFAGEIPVLNMPTDYPRPPLQSFAGERVHFEIKSNTLKELRTLALKADVSLYMLLMTLYNTLFSKYTGQEDIVVGVITAGREKAEVNGLVGIFINTLAIRNYPKAKKTFKEFLKEVKTVILKAFANQSYPFGNLIEKVNVKKDLSRTPLFEVMMIYQNLNIPVPEVKGLHFLPYDAETVQMQQPVHAQHDITLWVTENEEELLCDLEYCTKLFKKETMERFTRHFSNILREIVKDSEITLSQLDMMGEEERKQVLIDFNATGCNFPVDKTIHGLFEQQAERIPDQIALVGGNSKFQIPNSKHGAPFGGCGAPGLLESFGEGYLSYRELNRKSNQLAYLLKEKGVKPGTIVGIMLERSLEMIVGLLGILKAGGAYLPIDPDYPEKRINFMLNDSNVKILLASPEVKVKAEVKEKAFEMSNMPHPFLLSTSTLTSTSTCQVSPTNLAYVIYTSGSTGKPKGVSVEHRNLMAYIRAFDKEFSLQPEDVVIQQASYCFDAFVEEMYPIMLKGGKLVIPPKGTIKDINLLAGFIFRHQVTLITCSPSLLNELNKLDPISPISSIHTFISGGDILKGEYIDNLLKTGKVYNTYGPTEATVCASYYRCPGDCPPYVPIGKPIVNYNVYLLDKYKQLLPVGIPGELCISGPGVTRGYLNNPGLTAEKFKRAVISSTLLLQ